MTQTHTKTDTPITEPAPMDAVERLGIASYFWAAERLGCLGAASRRFPGWLRLYLDWDARRLEAVRQFWGP